VSPLAPEYKRDNTKPDDIRAIPGAAAIGDPVMDGRSENENQKHQQ
jgi:hypothetical protein